MSEVPLFFAHKKMPFSQDRHTALGAGLLYSPRGGAPKYTSYSRTVPGEAFKGYRGISLIRNCPPP
jgi:hypothetical protein